MVDYDVTSGTPISRPDNVVYNPIGSPSGAFILETSADGGVAPLSAFVQAEAAGYDYGDASAGPAGASAAITFRPLVPNFFVRAMDPYNDFRPSSGFGLAQLYDETAGGAVLTIVGSTTPYDVSLNLDHLYTISVSANFCYCDPNILRRGVQLSLLPGPASVPESESTLTFFVVGLGALLLIARSQTFRPSN